MLYFSLIHSNLIYCIGPLSTMSSSNANKILKIQKKAIRSIAGATNREPSTPLFHKLKILPYNLLQKQAKLHFMHSVEYKYAPNTKLPSISILNLISLKNSPHLYLTSPPPSSSPPSPSPPSPTPTPASPIKAPPSDPSL